MDEIVIRPAVSNECEALSALCLRSKGWWGYDEVFLEACRADLTVTQQDIDGIFRVAELNGRLGGLVQVVRDGGEWSLGALFVDPPFIGRKVGAAMMLWAINAARENGARRLVIEADPAAVDFYRRFGAVDDGVVASSVLPGRFIPRLLLGVD
ncbi:MAG: GNAT family N-acetyltransferase [Rhizobiaceae bacterium]|nr:GNAT family N-acetyltransferase [Rhizobiaceae bacterium]